jgi:two-component system, NtrC family, sensor histidine kinase HydH
VRNATSHKVAVWSITASVLLLAAGAAGAWYVHILQGRVSWALADNVTSIRAALKLELAIRELRNVLDQLNISHDRAYLDRALAQQHDVEQAAGQVTHFASTEYEYGIVGKMNDGLKRFFKQLHELPAPAAGAAGATATAKVDDRVLVNDVLPYIKNYLDFNEAELADRSRDNEAMASWLALTLAILGIGGAAAGAAAGFGLARGIRRTVYQLTIPLRDVAGRLNQVVGPVTIDEQPEFEDLEQVLQKIAAEVNSVIEKFHATHRQVIRSDQLAALGQLAAGLAHELHNPLMSMKILVQSARTEGAPALDSLDLRVLDEEIARLQNLLQSFLTFARPAKLERSEVDLRLVISQTVTILAARAARRHVSIPCSLPGKPVLINADEAQLRQVVLNLLLNALDAVADNGTIWVELGSGSRLPPHEPDPPVPVQGIVLSVADNGRGLPDMDPERIFEPFFSTKETGLGLGLAICRRIVESHGGAIDVSRRPGGGAIFIVFLPATSPRGPVTPIVESFVAPALETEGASHA